MPPPNPDFGWLVTRTSKNPIGANFEESPFYEVG